MGDFILRQAQLGTANVSHRYTCDGIFFYRQFHRWKYHCRTVAGGYRPALFTSAHSQCICHHSGAQRMQCGWMQNHRKYCQVFSEEELMVGLLLPKQTGRGTPYEVFYGIKLAAQDNWSMIFNPI